MRLAGLTLAAKLRVPIRERRSCFMEDDRLAHAWSEQRISCSLSSERRASSAWELRRVLRYSRLVVGPSHLSSARGTSRAKQRENEGVEVVCTLFGGRVACDKEVVEVVVDGRDSLLHCCPLNGICLAVEDEGG